MRGRFGGNGTNERSQLGDALEHCDRLVGVAEVAEASGQGEQIARLTGVAREEFSVTPNRVVRAAVIAVQVGQQLQGGWIFRIQSQRACQVNFEGVDFPQTKTNEGQLRLQSGILGTVGGGITAGPAGRCEVAFPEVEPAQGQPSVGGALCGLPDQVEE